MENFQFETMLVESAKLPMVKIDRESFLRKELKDRFSSDVVERAIKHNPAFAGISVEQIDKIAKSCIDSETTTVTALSAAAGLPGGLAMLGTVPADLVQYFVHTLRILQELIYLYGWSDLSLNANEISEETKNLLTLFLGVMFGVSGATKAVNHVAAQIAKQIAKKLPQKALTKGTIYPIVKKTATLLGVKMSKQIFSRGIAKTVPVIGAVISGGLTFATYKPMSEKLRAYLASGDLANVDYYN